MKTAGMLMPRTDVDELAAKAFVHLDGVTDEWLQGAEVEKLADGQVPPGEDIRQYAQLHPARRTAGAIAVWRK